MIRLTTKEDKSIKDEIQENSDVKVLEVEKMFVASSLNTDVLFVKPEKQNAVALRLPKGFLVKFNGKE